MSDLTHEQVKAQLAALGLRAVDGEDLEEVTHRINAFREALVALEPEGLDALEPASVFVAEVARDEG